MGFIKWMDNLPLIGKLIFCIPVLNFVWGLYRIVKGAIKSNLLMLIVGILWIVPGAFFTWIIDLVTILLYGKPILTE